MHIIYSCVEKIPIKIIINRYNFIISLFFVINQLLMNIIKKDSEEKEEKKYNTFILKHFQSI